jgi:hypothetical protein
VTEPVWRILPTVVVRSAGFPWQLVDRLGHHESRRLAAELVGLRAEATALAATAEPSGRLPRSAAGRLRNLRPMPDGAPLPAPWLDRWNDLTQRVADTADRYRDTVAKEAEEAAAALAETTADPRFLEAVACSSPPAYRDLRKGVRGARLRRQAASYAQRLAAKCETMSFFGPINYGRIDPAAPDAAHWTWDGPAHCPGRRAFTAARVTDRVQAAFLSDPDAVADLVPRRKTLLRPLAGTAAGRPVTRLTAAADGVRTVARLGHDLGLDPASAAVAFRTAVDRGLLTHSWQPPATVADPVGWLAARLDEEPGGLTPRLRTLVRGLQQLLDDYPAAPADGKLDLQARLTALAAAAVPEDTTGPAPGPPDPAGHPAPQPGPAEPAGHTAPRATDRPADGARPAGGGDGTRTRFYNDRVIIHEAARGTLDLTIGGPLAADLATAVAPVLDLLAHDAALTREAANRAVAARLGPGRFPLLAAMRACADLPFTRSDALTRQLTRVLADPGTDTAAPTLDLTGRIAVPPPSGPPVLCSVDVMVQTPDLARYRPGATPLVLGDIHDAALLTPWALQFHPRADVLRAERDTAVLDALGSQRAVTVIARRTTGLPPLEFPGLVLELGGTGSDDDAPRIGLDQLTVHSDGSRAELRAAGHPAPLLFHNGELDTAFHTALALPRVRRPALPSLAHLPRLHFANAVLSRRRWTVGAAELAPVGQARDDAGRLLAAADLCARRGLPDTFFAASANERKPVYVDTSSPALLDCLLRLAGTADSLTLGEALPGRADSWLHRGDQRVAAELRCVYLRGAA